MGIPYLGKCFRHSSKIETPRLTRQIGLMRCARQRKVAAMRGIAFVRHQHEAFFLSSFIHFARYALLLLRPRLGTSANPGAVRLHCGLSPSGSAEREENFSYASMT